MMMILMMVMLAGVVMATPCHLMNDVRAHGARIGSHTRLAAQSEATRLPPTSSKDDTIRSHRAPSLQMVGPEPGARETSEPGACYTLRLHASHTMRHDPPCGSMAGPGSRPRVDRALSTGCAQLLNCFCQRLCRFVRRLRIIADLTELVSRLAAHAARTCFCFIQVIAF